MTSEPVLLTECHQGVLTLTLNRPERRNAIDGALWAELEKSLRKARNDSSVGVVVLTGAGGAFSAGADLGGDPTPLHPMDRMRRVTDVVVALHEMPKPTIAKVTGVAVGVGWNLALACDLVVASATARFSEIFAKRGLSVDGGGSWLLPRLVGLQQAKRLVLLADMIDADQARALQLVTWVLPDDEVDGFVADLAGRLATGPRVALSLSKALLNESSSRTLREALEVEARAQAVNFGTADTAAAYRAFFEKRDPEFTGEWMVNRP